MSENKIRTLIGFATRAGKIAVGRSSVTKALFKNKVALLILAGDASPKIIKEYGKVPNVRTCYFLSKTELGEITGRKETAVLGICDDNFASSIKKLLPPEAFSIDRGNGF